MHTTTASAALGPAAEWLDRGDTPALMAHLLALDAPDRTLRFSANHVADATIARYVHAMRFGIDSVLAMRDDGHRVIALAHGAPFQFASGRCVEVSFSVARDWRHRGLCKRLFETLQRRAHREGAAVVIAQCSLANRPMRGVFMQAGMTITFDRDDVHGRMRPTGLSCFGSQASAEMPFTAVAQSA